MNKWVNGKTKNIQDFENEVKDKNIPIKIIKPSEFKNYTTTPIEIECLDCGANYYAVPGRIVRTKYHCCDNCRQSRKNPRKLTHQDFLNKLPNDYMNHVEFLTDYNGMEKTIKCKCKKCNNIYETLSSIVLHSNYYGCKNCAPNQKISQEKFEKLIKEKYKGTVSVCSEYKGSNDEITLFCSVCNNIWDTTPSIALHREKSTCPKCSFKIMGMNKRINQNEIDKRIKNINKDLFRISDYTKMTDKITCGCKRCNGTFTMFTYNLLERGSCPICKISKGERKIIDYLENKKINYEREVSFPDLFGDYGMLLRYDFVVYDGYENIKLIIEYDGEFHYKRFYNIDFEKQKRYDKKKDDYCKNNNLEILRIPYWEFDNIENILDKIFI